MYYCSYGILKYRSLKFDQIVMKAERSTSNCTFVLLTSSHMSDVTLSSVVIKNICDEQHSFVLDNNSITFWCRDQDFII